MSNDQAFDMPPLVRGLGQLYAGFGQDPVGGAAGSSSDGGNSLTNPDPATGLINPATGEPGAPGDDGGGTVTYVGGGGTSGGGATGSAASTTAPAAPGSLSSALSSLTTGNTPYILGGLALVAGIAGVAYLAHRGHLQSGGAKKHKTKHFFRHHSSRSGRRAHARRR